MGLPLGKIHPNDVVKILNTGVSFIFEKLEKLVASLSSKYLLEFLIGHHEAIVTERAFRQINIPTQLACFMDSEELTKQLVEHMPKLAEAATACRFLIEYVAAKPPSGIRPISMSVYDELMAIALEIISRGTQSDLAQYNLFDVQLSMLPSGRLGINLDDLSLIQNAFLGFRSREEIDDATQHFDYWWRPRPDPNPDNRPLHIKIFDQAFYDEFGFPLLDLSLFVSSLGDLSIDINDPQQFKTIEMENLVEYIEKETKWDREKIVQMIDFVSLYPRESFLTQPKPFTPADIYPWRMGRGLSYMRRPIIQMVTDGKIYAGWGVRHLFASFEYILQMATRGGLQQKYQSKSMQEWLGKERRKDGFDFNEKVYKAVSAITNDVIVGKGIKKFGSVRIENLGYELGDIDVLVILPTIKTIWLIECKNLEIARTPNEMRSEIEELFIDSQKGLSAVSKHLRRKKWVWENLDQVLSAYNLTTKGSWKIKPLLVVSRELFTLHFHKPSIEVLSYLRFVEYFLPRVAAKGRSNK